MSNFLNIRLVEQGSFYISWWDVILILSTIVLVITAYKIAYKRLHSYTKTHETIKKDEPKNRRRLIILGIFIFFICTVFILRVDYEIIPDKDFGLTISRVFMAAFIIVLARLLDCIISNRIDEEIIERGKTDNNIIQNKSHGLGVRIAQYIILGLCICLLLKNFDFLDFTFNTVYVNGNQIDISLSNIVIAILILLVSRLIVWLLTNLFFLNLYRRRDIDRGKQYAYNQLLSYLVYFFGALFAFQFLGINMTLIWTGAAALLVGIGIALQQTISDFFSGIVLLFERSVKVGDFLEIGTKAGNVRRIGLRASTIETRDNKTIIIPNSQLVNDRVVNWSNLEELARFSISIGVAYGSDDRQIEQELLRVCQEHPLISKYPKPFVRFNDFGDSALIFELIFFTRQFILVENIKSDLRFAIYQRFNKLEINIPFPQRDVWLRDIRKLD